jgi:hypothetical protein
MLCRPRIPNLLCPPLNEIGMTGNRTHPTAGFSDISDSETTGLLRTDKHWPGGGGFSHALVQFLDFEARRPAPEGKIQTHEGVSDTNAPPIGSSVLCSIRINCQLMKPSQLGDMIKFKPNNLAMQ